MKNILLISFITISVLNLSAQDGKQARKDLRSGNKAFREQLYGTAEANYIKAATADPTSTIASYNLATTYYKEQHWDDALKEYERYLSLEKDDHMRMSNVWSSIGNVYLRKKGDEPAQKRAKQAEQMQSGQAPEQGGDEKKPDNLKLSIEAYKNALRLNPKDDDTRYNLAVAQKMLKDKQGEGGGGDQDNKQDQNKDKDDNKQDQNKDPNKDDKNKDKQQDQDQMSQGNMEQILQALEQEEKQTQERVQKGKEQQRQRQNANNKRQNKDW